MQFKMKALVAAAAVVVSGSAFAAIDNYASGNGELFLNIYDPVAKVSFIQRARSFGSPESATQRNGPFPSQKSGLMYSGTKPGMSNALLRPASKATVRMLLP